VASLTLLKAWPWGARVGCGRRLCVLEVFRRSSPACPAASSPTLSISGLLLCCSLCGLGVLGSATLVPGVSVQPSSGERLHRPTVRRPSSQGEEAGSLLRRWYG
jgi:hypothetical protein